MKILFSIHSLTGVTLLGPVAKRLQDKGNDIYYVTLSKTAYETMKAKGLKKVFYMYDYMRKIKVPKNPIKKLKEFEDRYDININNILYGDFDHCDLPRREVYPLFIRFITFWQEFLNKHKPDAIFGGLERMNNQSLQSVAKKLNIPFNYFELGIPIENRFVIDQDLMGYYSPVEKYWKKNKNRKLTKKERTRAQEYLKAERKKYLSHFFVKSKPTFTLKKIKFFLKMVYTINFVEKGRNPYMVVSRGLKRYFMRFFRYLLAKPLYVKPSNKDKVIMFFLHCSNDAQILMRARHYKHQEFIIETIANSLPVGYTLYLKEHPLDPGDIKTNVLRKMNKMPNVKIINPAVSARRLIKMAEGVITINGTAGWEALINKTPLISFGRAHYEMPGLSRKVRDIYEVPIAIKEFIKTVPDEEKLMIYINALYEGSHEGNVFLSNLFFREEDDTPLVVNDTNLSNITNGIIKQLRKEGFKVSDR